MVAVKILFPAKNGYSIINERYKMKTTISILACGLLSLAAVNLSGQVPVVPTPRPGTLMAPSVMNFPDPVPSLPFGFPDTNMQNRAQMEMYERDRQEAERRQREAVQGIYTDYVSSGLFSRGGNLPVAGDGTLYFYKAAARLEAMLSGAIPLSLQDAVFIAENAYLEEKLDPVKYDNMMDALLTTAQEKAAEEGYDWNNPLTRKIMLFRVMSDTLEIKKPFREHAYTSYPMQYDFEDFMGKEDYTKQFVTKLLATRKGQCHSLPMLYLILCEKAGTEAYLAYSPSHSYVKFQDAAGNWYNLELTHGCLATDAFLIGSGFITAEAIRQGTFMEPQTRRQVIASCLTDLVLEYIHKYGYDEFVQACTDSVLKYDPKSLRALMVKSNYETMRFVYALNQVGRPHPDTLKVRYPEIYRMFNRVDSLYRKIDVSGFREMPLHAYKAWLESVNEEKEKRAHDEKYYQVIRFGK